MLHRSCRHQSGIRTGLPQQGLGTLMRHGIEVIDLDMGDAKQLLGRFIEANPKQWNEDIGR